MFSKPSVVVTAFSTPAPNTPSPPNSNNPPNELKKLVCSPLLYFLLKKLFVPCCIANCAPSSKASASLKNKDATFLVLYKALPIPLEGNADFHKPSFKTTSFNILFSPEYVEPNIFGNCMYCVPVNNAEFRP